MSSDGNISSDDETYVPPHEGGNGQSNELEFSEHDAGLNEIRREEVDKLWDDFKNSTKPGAGVKSSVGDDVPSKSTVKVTTLFDFAGEEVSVTEELSKDSKEAETILVTGGPVRKRSGGLQGVLGKMCKKPKLSTLQKSQLDWNSFKEEKGIADELKTHNKGKDGYIGKKLFLERTDYRQFEKERDMRLMKSSKR